MATDKELAAKEKELLEREKNVAARENEVAGKEARATAPAVNAEPIESKHLEGLTSISIVSRDGKKHRIEKNPQPAKAAKK